MHDLKPRSKHDSGDSLNLTIKPEQSHQLQFWLLLVQRSLLLLLFFQFFRLLFYVYNQNEFMEMPVASIMNAWWFGLRFDLSAIFLSQAAFFTLMVLPVLRQPGRAKKIFECFFYAWVLTSFLANIADVELYQFTGKRMTFDFLFLLKDWFHQATQLSTYYWGLALVIASSFVAFVFLDQKLQTWLPCRSVIDREDRGGVTFRFNLSRLKWLAQSIVFLLIVIVSARGGLQLKPLKTAHAYQFDRPILGAFALNSVFSVLRTKSQSGLKEVNTYPDLKQAREVIQRFYDNGSQTALADGSLNGNTGLQKTLQGLALGNAQENRKVKNVIVIILESFALEYMGTLDGQTDYTPFLSELGRKGVFFKNHFANGRRSIEAVPSILCSVPSLMNEPFITSNYTANQLNCLGSNLKKMGYHTSFFHGGENGTMFFDSFSRRAGFDSYYGLNEFPDKNQENIEESWGVYDEPFFSYFKHSLDKTQDQTKTPFAAVFFSLTSHQPYAIPAKYQGRFPKGELEIHESLGYADFALKQFFEQAKTASWYNETLFVITADHTQKSNDPRFQNSQGVYRVPLIFYQPAGDYPHLDASLVAQHVDIQPTILHWLSGEEPKFVFGQSLIGANAGLAVNRTASGYWMMTDKDFYSFSEGAPVLRQKWTADRDSSGEPLDFDNNHVQLFHAYFQSFANGMISNSLTL